MENKPKILLVNDDGAEAQGLWTLYEQIERFAEPLVIAPAREQSGRSHAVTVRKPMALSEIRREGKAVGYQLDGMPADCVKLALVSIWPDAVSLVISGINAGSNAGHNILYSGTVAAAIEAAMYGLPALAVSLRDTDAPPTHFETAATITGRIAGDVLEHGLPRDVILNVNVPDLPLDQIAGTLLTRQGRECYVDVFESDGKKDRAWVMNVGSERRRSPEGDETLDDLAVAGRWVSVTPLHFDLTCEAAIESLRGRFSQPSPLA